MPARLGVLGLLLLAACTRKDAAPAADSAAAAVPAAPSLVATTEGLSTPESVLFDSGQNLWFVSNINGEPGARDNNGFISRLGANGAVDSLHFIQGGSSCVTLNSPCGMTITGDTLWVADIDAVHGFNRLTGAPVGTIHFSEARFLNDLAVGPDGTVYVTDTGIQFRNNQWTHPEPDRIYAITGRKASVALEGAWLNGPNGIIWQPRSERFLLVTDSNTVAWKPGTTTLDTLGKGVGGYDGIVILKDKVLISSWTDSSINVVADGQTTRLFGGVESPADLGVMMKDNILAIPSFLGNKVEFWKIP